MKKNNQSNRDGKEKVSIFETQRLKSQPANKKNKFALTSTQT
jgi:hypothetical protein